MMNPVWLQLFAVMIGGSIFKYMFFYPLAAVTIDIAVLAICYFILRRHPYVDIKQSMIFLGLLTAVSILTDFGVISAMLGNIAVLALLVWILFRQGGGGSGGGRRRQQPIRHKWHK